MDLTSGTRLGPYEIVARIGAGGMGEVWKARDTRLDRSVAIKVLPGHLASNEGARERFDREARAISSLTHPNICGLFDLGEHEGMSYLVMEYLEGETLADRIERGPLPVGDLLRYGVEIADALDKAHRQGIVHRDLKPGNVMLTKGGAKLLDFGLAKYRTSADLDPVGGLTNLPTQNRPLTQEGTILGTFQYMAPEQLEGREADARTDIFSLGAVLYEMTTGRRAFSGASKASLIAAIVSASPEPVSQVQPLTPPALERVIRVCLSKDPDGRWQSAHDLAEELRWIAEAGSQAGIAAPVLSRRKNRERVWIAAAVAATIVAAAAATIAIRGRGEAPRIVRSALVPPPGGSFEIDSIHAAALTISPDGRFVTFRGRDSDGKAHLYLRQLDAVDAVPIAGSEDAYGPFWTPDSRSIGFFANGKVHRIDIVGGPAATVTDSGDARGGSWNAEGTLIFEPSWREPIHVLRRGESKSSPVTKLDLARSETTHRWPWFLPDGRHFLFLGGSHRVGPDSDLNAIYSASIDSPVRTLVVRARSNPVFASGYLLYVRDRYLLAQKFDSKKLAVEGEPVQLASDVTYDSGFFRAAFAASEEGTLVYFTGASGGERELHWFDSAGQDLGVVAAAPQGVALGGAAPLPTVAISPDGRRAAIDAGDTADIWILDLERGTRSRFTSDPLNDGMPVWSPDGKAIAFISDRNTPAGEIFIKAADGLTPEQSVCLIAARPLNGIWSWSPDGKFLAIDVGKTEDPNASDIWIVPATPGARPEPFIATEFHEEQGRFSPDGRWFTFISDESGQRELYATHFPEKGEKVQLTTGGVAGYVWQRDGRQIVYTAPDQTLLRIPVSGADFGKPVVMFKPSLRIVAADPTRDGTRFLAIVAKKRDSAPITLVTNWPQLVKGR